MLELGAHIDVRFGAILTGGAAVAINIFGAPEAEVAEGSAAVWLAIAGEPITSNIIIGVNFGGLGLAGGSATGAVLTQPTSPGCS